MIKSINDDERKIAQARYAEDLERMWHTEREIAIEEGRNEGRAQGLYEGRLEGLAEGRKEIAIRLLNKGLSVEDISNITSLSKKQIEELM